MRPWDRVKSLHATTLKTTAGQRANQTEILKSLFQATMKRRNGEQQPHPSLPNHVTFRPAPELTERWNP